MVPLRIQAKFFLEQPERVDLAAFTAVFQRWIQQKALKGQLIDVADYRHVQDGPGIILIGHESDWSIEKRGDRVGLLYTRKRQTDPDFQTQLRTSLHLALDACQLLEAEPSFNPRLRFRADEIEIRFADRLQVPNRPESFDLVKDDLSSVLTELYGGSVFNFAPVSQDSRYLFTVNVQNEGKTSITELFSSVKQAQKII
jgi:hypothetical protein